MTRLGERLIRRIAEAGPISIADYMTACLHDPEDGYYATRPALGDRGDFITAPLVSQMFGELIGLWAAEVWRGMGAPPAFTLAEFGPGDGTMMADMLRAGRAAPGFAEAAEVWLVETSEPLIALQAKALRDRRLRWAAALDELPDDRPLIAVGNEFLDCLPIQQAVKTPDGWRRRCVGLGAGELTFVEGPRIGPADDVEPGLILERSLPLEAFGRALGARLARGSGAALFIDYGYPAPAYGDTLQAVRRHRREPPLANPGEADLTAWVNFPDFMSAAVEGGVVAEPLESQADFLRRMGLRERSRALSRLNPLAIDRLRRQRRRLEADSEMGRSFKVSALRSPSLSLP